MTKIGTLNVACVPFSQRGNGPNAKRRNLTRIFVRMGAEVVAERVILGRWDTAQALAEFKRFPDRFTPRPSYNAAFVKAIAA